MPLSSSQIESLKRRHKPSVSRSKLDSLRKRFNVQPKQTFLDKTLNVLDTPDALFRAGLQYLGEEITGKDYYKEGDFRRILKGKGGGSWTDSFDRMGGKYSLGKGLALDVLTSPTTWLTLGIGSLTKAGKGVKVGKKAVKLKQLANKAKGKKALDLAEEATRTFQKSVEIGKGINKSQLDKVAKGVIAYDKIYGGAILAKGITEFVKGDSASDRLKGLLFAGLGAMGTASAFKAPKTMKKLVEYSKLPTKQFEQKALDLLVTGEVTNIAEKAANRTKITKETTNFITNKVFDFKPNKKAMTAGRLASKDKEFSRAVMHFFDDDIIDPRYAEYLTPEFKVKIRNARNLEKDYLKRHGDAVIDDHISVRLLASEDGGKTYRLADPTEPLQLKKYKSTNEIYTAIKNNIKGKPVGKRDFDTIVKRDEYFKKLFDEGKTDVLFKTNDDFFKVFNDDMVRTKNLLANEARANHIVNNSSKALTKNLTGVDDTVQVYNPEKYVGLGSKMRKESNKIIKDLIKTTKKLKKASKKTLEKDVDEISKGYERSMDDIINNSDIPIENIESSIKELNETYASRLVNRLSESKLLTKAKNKSIINIKKQVNKTLEEIHAPIVDRVRKLSKLGYELPDQQLMMSGKGFKSLAYKPAIKQSLKNITSPFNEGGVYNLVGEVDTAIRNLKLVKVIGDFFQYGQVFRRALSHGRLRFAGYIDFRNPAKTTKNLEEMFQVAGRFEDQAVQTFLDGLRDSRNMNKVETFMRGIEGTIQDKKVLRPLNAMIEAMKKNEHIAFNTLTVNAKVKSVQDITDQLIKKGVSKEQAKHSALNITNDMFSGQNWEAIMARNPGLTKDGVRMLRIFTFAPDYLYSNLRKTFKLTERNAVGKIYRDELFTGLFFGYMLTQGLNYSLNGHGTWDNLDGNEMRVQVPSVTDEKGNPLAVNVMGNWGEPLRFMDNPTKYTSGKTSSLINLITGTKSGYGVDIKDYAPVPLAAQPLMEYAAAKLTDKKQSQAPSSLGGALIQAGIEETGAMGTFASGKSSKFSSLRQIAEDITK